MAQGIETKIGRVPTVAGEGVVDSSLKTRQLQSGLSQLSTSLKEFGIASDARRIQNDIITARTAFALNEEMPGSLAFEAEIAYDGLVAVRSTQQFFRLLADDADVYKNGLLTDDENYPDHNSKQAAFESFIEGAKGIFFEQAQFSPAQQESILQYVADRSNTLKTDFATLAAKDIKALKKNEAAKFVQENILDRQTSFNQLRKSNTVNATRGWTTDTHIKGSSAFSRDWHEDLKKKLSIANPHLTEDELDEIIIQQIGLLATDPDNPHPEYLEYFNESGKGGKPAINIIPSLAKNARELYTKARSAFISHHKAKNTLANKVQKDRENLAHINAQNYIIEEIGSLTGHRDLTKLTEKIREKFPHIAAPKLQSVINFANTLISADKKDGNSQLTTRMVLEATKGHLSLLDFEAGTRIDLLNQGQIVEVQKAITNYSVGEINENQKNLITELDSFTELLENAVASKVVIKFGKDKNGADKTYDFSSERMRFNSITQRPTGFSPKASSIMDAIINQFHDAAEIIIYDNKNTDPKDARRELSKLKYQFLREVGILNDGNETTIPTKKVTDSRDYGTSAADLFKSQHAEDTSKEAIASTSSGIEHIFKADVPDDYNPVTHVPPTSLFFLDSLRKKSKDTPKDVPKTSDDIVPPTPLKSSPEVKDEKDTIVPRDIPTDVLGDTESVPVTKTLNRAEQRSEAFDKARPDKPPSERVKLRELQDKAKFQDDRTIFDAVKDTVKKAFGDSDSPEEIKSLIKSAANEFKVSEKDLATIIKLESSTGRNLKNPTSSATGLGQIINSTAKDLAKRLNTTQYKVQNDHETNARATALLFKDALKRYKNTEDPRMFAFLDQHAGATTIKKARNKADNPNNLDSVLEHIENKETIDFIQKVRNSEDSPKDSPNLKVSSLQKMFGASEAEASKIQMMGNIKGTTPTIYKIKQGDTLSKIAKDNDMTVKELQKLNNIKNVNKIRAGQEINIGRFSMDIKDVKPPQVPDDVPKFFKENLIPIYDSHAVAALRQMIASQIERAGLPVPSYLRSTITEKFMSPDVLNSVRVAAYKALINKRPTSYKDYGDAWKLVYGNERSKMSDTGQALKALSSFFDPGMAAAFTIGESSGVVVRNGNLMIVGDEFNFPKIPEGTHDGSFWHTFNSMFADEDDPGEGEAGIFSVTPKNRQKIEINLGPIDQIKKYVRQIENKKDKKVK
jgi:LysM repeat protein